MNKYLSKKHGVRFCLAVILVALAACVVIVFTTTRFTVSQRFVIPDISPGDTVLISKLPVKLGLLKVGSIVAFEVDTWRIQPRFVSSEKLRIRSFGRVIALPGQTISKIGDRYYVDGEIVADFLDGCAHSLVIPCLADGDQRVLGDSDVFLLLSYGEELPSWFVEKLSSVKKSNLLGTVSL